MAGQAQSATPGRAAAHRGCANSQETGSEFLETAGHCHPSATLQRAGFFSAQEAKRHIVSRVHPHLTQVLLYGFSLASMLL